jgi:hypothetical protein
LFTFYWNTMATSSKDCGATGDVDGIVAVPAILPQPAEQTAGPGVRADLPQMA